MVWERHTHTHQLAKMPSAKIEINQSSGSKNNNPEIVNVMRQTNQTNFIECNFKFSIQPKICVKTMNQTKKTFHCLMNVV